jgi:hypothetical protein
MTCFAVQVLSPAQVGLCSGTLFCQLCHLAGLLLPSLYPPPVVQRVAFCYLGWFLYCPKAATLPKQGGMFLQHPAGVVWLRAAPDLCTLCGLGSTALVCKAWKLAADTCKFMLQHAHALPSRCECCSSRRCRGGHQQVGELGSASYV